MNDLFSHQVRMQQWIARISMNIQRSGITADMNRSVAATSQVNLEVNDL